MVTSTRFVVILVAACAALSACSQSPTDDPNVAAIQQLRQDAAVTLPGDVAEDYDDLLAAAVDEYLAGRQAQTESDDAAAEAFFVGGRDLVNAYIDGLDEAVRAQRTDADTVQQLKGQAESIVRDFDSLITGEPPNNRPVANAGGDRTITNETTVQLDGSGSRDADGDPLSYRWTLESSPANSNASFSDPAISNPQLTVDQAGIYEVALTVNDGIEDSDPDRASIELILDNSAPVADAGRDQTAAVGATVTLDGTGSSDIDGDSLGFAWTIDSKPDGSGAILSDATATRPTIGIDLAGSYVVTLVVNDGELDSQPDSVKIDTINTAPVADAGMDQRVEVGSLAMLDGGNSSDIDGDRLEYAWSISNKPAGSIAQLSDPSIVNPTFDVDLPGRYEIELIVSDGIANSQPDTVEITTLNVAPVADAGPDRSPFVGDIVSLDGTGSSDADGDPLTFEWSLTTIPDQSNADFDDPTATQPSFVVDRPGTYVAQLIVDDGEDSSAPDTVTVTTENSVPVADAGEDQNVIIGEVVTLDGRGSSDADFDDLSYRWSFTAVPGRSGATIADPTAPVASFVPDIKGKYDVQLVVNDGQTDSVPDLVRFRASEEDD